MPHSKKRTRKDGPAASVPYEPWLIERLKDPAEAAGYLEAILEDGDPGAIAVALRQLARADHKV